MSFRSLVPTPTWLRTLFVPVLVFVACCVDRNYQCDFWHHLARGQAIAEQGHLVDVDQFTYTVAGEPLRDANWLTQLAYYHLFRIGGLPLVQVVNAAMLALMMRGLLQLCRARCGSHLASAAVGVLVFLGLWSLFLIRPQTLSLLLFVALLRLLAAAERSRLWLLAAPVVLALWVNLHGAFPVGLALIGAHLLGAALVAWRDKGRDWWRDRSVAPLFLCLIASGLATAINPYGIGVYAYVQQTAGRAASRRIDEWLPPGLDGIAGRVWAASVVLLLVVLALRKQRTCWRDLVLLAIFLPPACGSVRMVAWWFLVTAPLLAQGLVECLPRRYLEESDADSPSLGTTVASLGLGVALVLGLPWLERYNPAMWVPGKSHRVEYDLQSVAEALRHHQPEGRVFTRLEWGEYLGWALAPSHTVFMDGRIEIYPDRVWVEYSAVTRGRADWQRILEFYRVDALLLDGQSGYHTDLLALAEARPEYWERVAEAGPAILFLRRSREARVER